MLSCSSAPPWPEQFVLVQRQIPDDNSGNATTVTYYDWKRQANLIVITPDANETDVLWDLELGTKQSYYFRPAARTCNPMKFPVGIIRPDWLANATCLGKTMVRGRWAIGWTKANFIDYYADVETAEPISWYFHTSERLKHAPHGPAFRSAHPSVPISVTAVKARFDTVYWAPGQTAPTGHFSPPSYCTESASTTVARQ